VEGKNLFSPVRLGARHNENSILCVCSLSENNLLVASPFSPGKLLNADALMIETTATPQIKFNTLDYPEAKGEGV
jgi:hypothetical protein